MAIAHLVKVRSTCERAQVGCVVTDEDFTTVVSMGYNGNYRGGPDACDFPEKPGGCRCLHAEENALLKAPYDMTRPLVLVCTTAPCAMCAKRIANSAIMKVLFDEDYRDPEGLHILNLAGVQAQRVDLGPKPLLDWAQVSASVTASSVPTALSPTANNLFRNQEL